MKRTRKILQKKNLAIENFLENKKTPAKKREKKKLIAFVNIFFEGFFILGTGAECEWKEKHEESSSKNQRENFFCEKQLKSFSFYFRFRGGKNLRNSFDDLSTFL